jgi:hypothetical protein
MQAPAVNDALGVWERGAGLGQAGRGLALLDLAYPGTPRETLADLSIGARDTALLALREAMFGPKIEGCANCPACGGVMEMGFSTRDLAGEAPLDPPLTLALDGYELTLRPVTTRDLLLLDGGEDPRRELLSRCVVSACRDGAAKTAADLPAPVVDAAAQALAKADPQADIRLSIACAVCGHLWQAPFDIVSYLWIELESWAARILHEVHVLAGAYGWHEADILALNPARRRFYLDRIAS